MAQLLLIEPNRPLAIIYQTALQLDGHTVCLAHSAQAAIQAADSQAPELIILELQLAAHNGIEFLYELRSYSEWQAIPVVIQSLVPLSEFVDNQVLWRHMGIAAYLYKPRVSLAQLRRTIRTCLQPAAV